MKVLLQNPILPPYRLAFFQSLSKAPGIDLHLAYGQSQRGSALESIQEPEHLQVHPLRNLYIGGIPPRMTLQPKFPNVIRAVRPDVVIAGYDPRFLTNILGYFTARRLGIKWIWWGHGIRPRDRYHFIYKKMADMADAVILYGSSAKEKLSLLGVQNDKLFSALNSIDTTEIDEYYSSIPFDQRNRLLYIGRLIPKKKVDMLIRAFAEAFPSLPRETILTIIGTGPTKVKLQSLCVDFGLQRNVEFTGSLYTQEELSKYINHSFLSVSPGYIGLSAIHSLAYGVPILVADNEPHSPEIEILEKEVNGLYFESNSTVDLARHLTELSNDKVRLSKMGAMGRAIAYERFSVEAMVRSFQKTLDYVLK